MRVYNHIVLVETVPILPERPKKPRNRIQDYLARIIAFSPLHHTHALIGYPVALALIALAGWARMVLPPAIVQNAPFVLYYPSIALSAFLVGAGPALAATAAAALFTLLIVHGAPVAGNWITLFLLGPLIAAIFSHLRRLNIVAREAAHDITRFKYIADHATDTILQLDVTGRIRYANLMAAQHFGNSVADLTASDLPELLPAAQWENLREALVATLKGETRTVELILSRSGGSPLVLEMVCNGVWIEGEFIVHAAARDVTERRQIERRLSEVRHWESLGVMAGGMAHDFNNLLTTILGNASLVKISLPPGDESEPLLNQVIDAGERSADLVRLMLSTAGYRSRRVEWLHPALVLDNVLTLRPLPENVRVSVTAKPEVFPGDRRSLETLLWSLIANAAESYAGLAGEIRIALTSGPVEPRKTNPASGELHFDEGDAQGDCLGIVVEDSGCGMHPEVLERAFDPFYSSRFMGRGLGLPAVRGIVRAYSGTLRVSTLAGRGTRVEVWLPRSDKATVSARTKERIASA